METINRDEASMLVGLKPSSLDAPCLYPTKYFVRATRNDPWHTTTGRHSNPPRRSCRRTGARALWLALLANDALESQRQFPGHNALRMQLHVGYGVGASGSFMSLRRPNQCGWLVTEDALQARQGRVAEALGSGGPAAAAQPEFAMGAVGGQKPGWLPLTRMQW